MLEGMTSANRASKAPIRCRHCRRWGREAARGLIHTCYRRLREAGRLGEYPSLRYREPVRADVVLDEWRTAVSTAPLGTTHREIASRLGMTWDGLEQALCRARRRGDPRAVYLPDPRTGAPYQPARYRQVTDHPPERTGR